MPQYNSFQNKVLLGISLLLFVLTLYSCPSTYDRRYFNGNIVLVEDNLQFETLTGKQVALDGTYSGRMDVWDPLVFMQYFGYQDYSVKRKRPQYEYIDLSWVQRSESSNALGGYMFFEGYYTFGSQPKSTTKAKIPAICLQKQWNSCDKKVIRTIFCILPRKRLANPNFLYIFVLRYHFIKTICLIVAIIIQYLFISILPELSGCWWKTNSPILVFARIASPTNTITQTNTRLWLFREAIQEFIFSNLTINNDENN